MRVQKLRWIVCRITDGVVRSCPIDAGSNIGTISQHLIRLFSSVERRVCLEGRTRPSPGRMQ